MRSIIVVGAMVFGRKESPLGFGWTLGSDVGVDLDWNVDDTAAFRGKWRKTNEQTKCGGAKGRILMPITISAVCCGISFKIEAVVSASREAIRYRKRDPSESVRENQDPITRSRHTK
jgi:hypothetical protein